MSDTLPQGFSLIEETSSPALPAGFSLFEDAKPEAPEIPEAQSNPNDPYAAHYTQQEDDLAELEKFTDIDFNLPFVHKLFGKGSKVGKLSPERQMKFVTREIEDAMDDQREATAEIARLEANRPEVARSAAQLGSNDRYYSGLLKQKEKLDQSQKRLEKIDGIVSGRVDAPEYGPVKNAVAGSLKMLANSFGEALPKTVGAVQATITGQAPEDTAAYKLGDNVAAYMDENLATDDARAETTLQQVAGGLGQAASMVGPGAALKAANVGGKKVAATMAGLGASQAGAQGLDDAIAFEADTNQKLMSFYGNAALGLTEAVPLNRLFSRINKASGGKVETIIRNSTAQGLEEMVQEIGQTVGSNVIAKAYDEDRKALDGVAEAGKVGGIIGALLGGGGTALAQRGKNVSQTPDEDTTAAFEADQKQEHDANAPDDGSDLPKGFTPVPTEDMPKPVTKPIRSAVIRDDVAVDPAGKETKVKYAIVEADDLVTSHDDALNKNDNYPQILQPRDRTRKASETQINEIASKLNPALLTESPQAESGSPIISSDGVVESGNARSIAIRRAYLQNGEKSQGYRDYLKEKGYPVDGFSNPVLVRVAPDGRTDEERISFTRRANGMTTAAMSVTERAKADAGSLTPADFEVAQYGDIDIASDIPFVRRVLGKISTEAERGQLIDKAGNLSVDGRRRVEAAVASYAYDDGNLVANLLETSDEVLQGIGKTLVNVAPAWAKLKAGIKSGDTDKRVDITKAIVRAAQIATDARRAGKSIADHTATDDMFNPEKTSNLNSVMGIFFKPDGKQRSQAAIKRELKYYAQEAQKASAAPSLLGDDGVDPSRRIFDTIKASRESGAKSLNVYEADSNEDGKPLFDKAPKTETAYRRWVPKWKGSLTIEKIQKYMKRHSSDSSRRELIRALDEFKNIEAAHKNLYYHGSATSIQNGLKSGSSFPESDLERRGGGYGEVQTSISLSKSRNTASNFTSQSRSGNVYPVLLKANANVLERPDVEDAIDLEDEMVKLWESGVDAVLIGNHNEDYSEQEIVILNPSAIVKMKGVSFPVFQKQKFKDLTVSEFKDAVSERAQSLINYSNEKGHALNPSFTKYAQEKPKDARAKAIEYVADDQGVTVEDVMNDLDEYEPFIEEAIDERSVLDTADDRILYDRAPSKPSRAEVKKRVEAKRASKFSPVLKDDAGPTSVQPKPKAVGRGRQERRAVAAPPDWKKVGHDGETPGLHKITNQIRKRFGAIARQGRMGNKGKNVLGFYNPNTGVIRTRKSYLAEIDTFAHEVGHHFEFMNGPDLRALMKRHAKELFPMDYDPHRKDKKVALSEGFAEFFTAYITNPEYAKRKAPKFAAEFGTWLDANHDGLRSDIKEFSAQYRAWLTAPSADSVAANIVPHPQTGMKAVVEAAKDQGAQSFAGTVLNKGIENFIDRLNPMKLVVARLDRIYRDKSGRSLDLKATDDPYKILRMAANAANKGVMAMFDGVAPRGEVFGEGASLQDAIMTAVGDKKKWTQENVTDFDAYLVARRAVQEWARFTNGEIKNPPTINSLADHKQAIKDFEASNPDFRKAAKQVHEFQNNLWKKKLDAGLITQELYDQTQQRSDYVPFRRDMSDKASTAKFTSGFGKSGKHSGGAHHFDGSNRPILSPLQSIMEDTLNAEKVIMQNDALRALVNMAKKAGRGGAAIVEMLPRKEMEVSDIDAIEAVKSRLKNTNINEDDQADLVDKLTEMWDGDGMTKMFKMVDANEKGENIVYVWQDGKRYPVKVGDPELAMDIHGMLLGVNDEVGSLLTDVFSVPTTILRMGITNHPMFIATNFIRDQLSTWIQSDAGFMPFVDGFKGVVSEITNDQYARGYNSMAGVSGGVNVSAFNKNKMDKDLNRLRARGLQVRRLTKLSEWAKLGDISESATRLGVFAKYVKQYKKQGMTDYEAFSEAAYEATDIMDFGMHGAQMQSARRLIPFLNAQIIGLYKSGRVLAPGGLFKTVKPYIKYKMGSDTQELSKAEKRNIERGARAWAKIGMVGLIGLAISAIHDDDEEYLEFNDYYRATHWITKVGDEWVLIPKPFELAAMSNLFERSYEAFKLKDKEAFAKLRRGLRGMLTPPMNVPAIAIPIEQRMNKMFFKNMAIVPRGTENYTAYAQFSANTSVMSKRIGEALNWSPARIDHVIKGMGGTMGRDLLRSTDALSQEKPALSPSNTPVISRLVKDPNYSSESINKLYKIVGTTSGKWHGLSQQLANALDDEDTKEVAKIMGFVKSKDEAAYVISNAIYKGKKIKIRRQHPMQRAKDASSVIGKAQKAIDVNDYAGLTLSRGQQRDIKDAMQELEVVMVRNGLKHANVKGWGQKSHSKEAPLLAAIKRASPEAHASLTAALKKKMITPENEIAKRYQQLKARLANDVKKYDGLNGSNKK